ncbi:hypothetical protein [Nonomuraea typhae]|uniref:hypothetical protein n=1 Tax=Nonomuraea typhae TaxID=2603600 RepID=UPI001CA497A6|nr:hypothetical protein [Nonomuraea typhae]
MSDRDKDVEILALRHQVMILQRQLGTDVRVRFTSEDRLFLAALLTSLPAQSCVDSGLSSARTPSCAGTAKS